MKNIAVIPARSGSKGIKDKNIKNLNGKPLIAYSIEAANASELFDEIFVSTDSEKYAEIARSLGANVPFLRDANLASDTAASLDVVKEAICKYKEMGIEFDTVALLQPTSPLRTANDIINGYSKMAEMNANSIVSVCETEHSPLWTNTLPENALLTNFINKEILSKPRQHLPTYYRLNGALYIIKTEYLMNTNDIYSDKSYAIIMSKEHSIDIDNEIDFKFAELLIRQSEFKRKPIFHKNELEPCSFL